jgi:hypothetical protein
MADPPANSGSSTEVVPAGHAAPSTDEEREGPVPPTGLGGDASLSLGMKLEGQAYSRLRSSDDFREGVEAFHAKRKPSFRGS